MKQITLLTGHTGGRYIYGRYVLNTMQRDVSKNDKIRGVIIPKEVSEDLAYLCGVFAGDGSIGYRRKKNEYALKVVGNPKDEREFYHQVIGPKFEKVFGIFPRMKYHDSKTTYGFSVYSKSIYMYLVNVIGLPSGVKYPSLKIPEIFLDDKKLIIAFIRGVFDTDGCISFKKGSKIRPKYPNISLASKSEYFIEEIAKFLKTTDLKFSTPYRYKQTDIRVKSGFTITYRLEIHGHKNLQIWMDTIGFYSPKHLAKIKKYGRF
ncbi:MAG: LAGLIDADG family homing endonuclease [Candidatus Woesearchaeota archaeon]